MWIMNWNLWTFYPKNPDPQFQSNRNFKVLQTHYLFMIARREPQEDISCLSLDQRDWTILLVISHTKKKPKKFFFENHDLISSENFWYNNDQSLIFPEEESSNLDLWSFLSKSLCFGQYFCHSMNDVAMNVAQSRL